MASRQGNDERLAGRNSHMGAEGMMEHSEEYLKEWDADCMRWIGRKLTGEYGHYCWEWDFLPIDETCEEFKACLCFGQKQKPPTEGF